jgi:uncharacterized pyridoxal phosphate-containing UPF0001 family protein
MPEDMDIAIAKGVTTMHAGTAIFWPRRYTIQEELAAR